VKAHHHFNDPQWDGEPLEPEPREPRPTPPPGAPQPPPGPEDAEPPPPRPRVKVRLGDGKARNIQHMMCTTFWHPDGTPMSAQQFMEMLFGKLPEFFKNETELRTLWSDPGLNAAYNRSPRTQFQFLHLFCLRTNLLYRSSPLSWCSWRPLTYCWSRL
jgi:type I restriction enzyme, R subunit